MKLQEKRDILAKQHAFDNAQNHTFDGVKKAYTEGWDRAIVESRRKTSYISLMGSIINVVLQELIAWLHLKLIETEKELR